MQLVLQCRNSWKKYRVGIMEIFQAASVIGKMAQSATTARPTIGFRHWSGNVHPMLSMVSSKLSQTLTVMQLIHCVVCLCTCHIKERNFSLVISCFTPLQKLAKCSTWFETFRRAVTLGCSASITSRCSRSRWLGRREERFLQSVIVHGLAKEGPLTEGICCEFFRISLFLSFTRGRWGSHGLVQRRGLAREPGWRGLNSKYYAPL
jgi:hypothetical protein